MSYHPGVGLTTDDAINVIGQASGKPATPIVKTSVPIGIIVAAAAAAFYIYYRQKRGA